MRRKPNEWFSWVPARRTLAARSSPGVTRVGVTLGENRNLTIKTPVTMMFRVPEI